MLRISLIMSGLSLLVALFALWKSHQSNQIAKEANKISKQACDSEHTRHKQKLEKEIMDKLINDFGRSTAVNLYERYKDKDFTVDDFNNYWENAHKKKKPNTPLKITFSELYAKHINNNN